MKLFTKKIIICILFFVVFFSFSSLAMANDGIVPDNHKNDGNYELNDLIVVAINVSKWVLGISGSLALLAFVVGGFYLILAGGNKEYIEKGKNAMVAAVIGLVIVFTAYTAIGYFLQEMGYQKGIFGDWNVAPR